MGTLEWCLSKINEVSQDLRESQVGANLEHQADKLDKVLEKLRKLHSQQVMCRRCMAAVLVMTRAESTICREINDSA